MAAAAPSRRERLRSATLSEIKQVARALLVRDGPAGVTLRAIAREMGMTAPALYRYYPNLEQLIAGLCADLHHEVCDHMETARDACPANDPGCRLGAVCHEFRRWSVEHPAEFGLIFASPLPQLADDGTDPLTEAHAAGMRFATVFLELFIQVWRQAPFDVPPAEEMSPELRDQLAGYLAALGTDLPPGAAQLFLSCWIRLYGMVAMEVFGHLHFALSDVGPMFDAELDGALRQLGIATG